MGYSQFAAASQFYLYGKKHCTQTGYAAAMKQLAKQSGWTDLLEDESLTLTGRVAMVTGSNSGVGKEVARFLAEKGAVVYLVCRSKGRGEEAQAELQAAADKSGHGGQVELLLADLGLEADVRRVWSEFSASRKKAEAGAGAGAGAGADSDSGSNSDSAATTTTTTPPPRLDVLVCNAGVLLNERTLTKEGVEITFACHLLFGTYLLGSLAMPALEATAESRMVCVASGGMYNNKFPTMEVAASREGGYDGNMAYVYAKRGQVLLMERWTKEHPKVTFVSCHPGWTRTPAVDAAYGKDAKYLEPMRTPWEGANGIAWLCVAPVGELEGGAFYLDRTPRRKHIAGPFFSEGTYTKNTPAQVDAMMQGLEDWANGRRPANTTDDAIAAAGGGTAAVLAPESSGGAAADDGGASASAAAAAASGSGKLLEMSRAIEIEKFMGRWFVAAALPTRFEQGKVNSIEDYSWNDKKQRIDVAFRMQSSADAEATANPTVLLQRATIVNAPTNTRWSLSPKFGVFLPLGLAYLVLDCADDYSHAIIGVPDRKYVWILTRTHDPDDDHVQRLIESCAAWGYNPEDITRSKHDYSAGMPEYAFKDAATAKATLDAASSMPDGADEDDDTAPDDSSADSSHDAAATATGDGEKKQQKKKKGKSALP